MAGIQLVDSIIERPPTDRVGRYPKHTFNVFSKPFSITPIGIAPVLPGETLKSIFMESRVVTDPILNPITGWKKEYFYFYVRATDILGDAIRNMFIDIDDNSDLTLTNGVAANDLKYYTAKGGVQYLEIGMRKIVDAYFRDEGELFNNSTINGYPGAQIREATWMDSLKDKDLVPDQLALDAAADTGDLERLMMAFETLRGLGLANMSYEDYLGTFGIKVDEEEATKPLLLHHDSNFQYPSNTVSAADGSVASAVSWVFRGGEAKKRRFFKEPGFIIGLSLTRPKIYFGGLAGNMAAHLTRAWDWLPELLLGQPVHSLKKFEAATGPLGDRGLAGVTVEDTDAYFADMRDLFLHGDQFQNRVAFQTDMADAAWGASNIIALPDINLNWKYPTDAIVNSLFKVATGGIRQDGYFSLNIAGKQRDHTIARLPSQA
jgi:hypothetical protein